MIANAIPKYMNVVNRPTLGMRAPAMFAVRSADPPKPASMRPTARPFLSGNQRAPSDTGQPYARPTPEPAMTP